MKRRPRQGPMRAGAIRRILERGKGTTFWGERSYISLRIPLTAIPDPYPRVRMPPGWKVTGMFGTWHYDHGDGTRSHISFYTRGGDADCVQELRDSQDSIVIRIDEYGADAHCAEVGRWHLGPDGHIDRDRPVSTHYAGDAGFEWIRDVVEAQVAQKAWANKYVYDGHTPELFDLMWEVQHHRRATYYDVGPQHLTIIYGVKPFQRETMLRFCEALSRLHAHWLMQGVPVRVRRGRP